MRLIKLFRWFKGYVTVKCSGENSSAFINYLLKSKIKIWDIKKQGNHTVFNLSLYDYMSIIKIRHGFKLQIKLKHIGFFGLPRKLRIVSKRKSIAVGILLFFTILFLFNSFVWNIEIVGNETIEEEKIISAYTELGVKIGMPKRKLDSYSLRDRLPLMIREVSWCSFNLEGTKLTINITEISETDKSNKKIYSNLVASTDGIIKQIDIISGNKAVNVGDVIRKGELLVSGAPELNSQKFTFSKGEIIAETVRNFTVKIPKTDEYNYRSGLKSRRDIIDIFGFKIPLYLDGIHFEYVSNLSINSLSLCNQTLPIKIISREFFEIDRKSQELNREDALNEAKANLINEIKSYDIKNFQIINSKAEEDNDSYIFSFECKCLENISETRQINVSS